MEIGLGWRKCYDWKQTLASAAVGVAIGGAGGWWVNRTGCFVAGTLVVMADHSRRVIEQIKVGDRVLSRDEKTGTIEAKRVKRVFERVVAETLALTFAGGERIETTANHPFYVQGKGSVPAGSLGIGTLIVTRAGPAAKLEQIEHPAGPTKVYNLEVEDLHSYFVGRTGGGLWVHNLCGTVRAAPLVPGAGGQVTPGRLLTYREALDAIRRGEDVIASGRSLAKGLAKSASGINRAIGPEIHGDPTAGFLEHFHPSPRNFSHVFLTR